MLKQSPSLFLSSSFSYIFPRGRSHIASSIREKGFHKIQILSRSRSPPTGHDVKGMGSVETELCPAGLCSGPGRPRTREPAGVCTCSLTDQHVFIYRLPPQACSLHPLELPFCHFFFSSPIHSLFTTRFQAAGLSLGAHRGVACTH